MSFVRRLAVGLPAAGVTAFAALALSSPALAAADTAQAGHPAVMASPDRGNAGYGAEQPAATTAPATVAATTPPAAVTAATASPATTGGTRGHAGYGGESPTATPSLPTGGAKTVPGGVSSETAAPPVTTKGGGVSNGSLPLTGGPVAATVAVGAMLVAGGAGALWYTRRRKTA
ncbi:LPXTG-motif cell wall-anchored protein [Actinoplanes octamycinicus]|uniref:LPXTG-motif cell wall-anchored protein n=1 Tax=Actinoplanes octamycinicus TaxID=135948 RepID=A0A7W7M4N2_9ACTN|nr:LPXTG cell wall anchor domain-containing protein [Actinoplanes octamycinicus]MBB4736788.1 LPXTG-motif cell wall-anchored protein [Actinoplanes octamycinicus]GIE60555.1 hypothetical protein Aoc01nite_59570 [Actinoplanes octamycinicus]